MIHPEQHSVHKITARWCCAFALPLIILMMLEIIPIYIEIKHNKFPTQVAIRLLADVAGQLGICIGISISPQLNLTKIQFTKTSLVVSSIIHSLIWTLLYIVCWSILCSAKLNMLIIPRFDRLVLLVMICSFAYAFIELLTISWQIRKYVRTA